VRSRGARSERGVAMLSSGRSKCLVSGPIQIAAGTCRIVVLYILWLYIKRLLRK
jgi:hypothetical protein